MCCLSHYCLNFFPPESGEEDNVSQSTLSSVTLYPPGNSSGTQPSPTPTKNSQTSTTPSMPSKAAAPLEEGDNKEEQREKASSPVVKIETNEKHPRVSPSQEDSDGVVASPSPSPPQTSDKRGGDKKKSSKYRRHSKKRDREEGEDSDESVDSESDSEDSSEPHSHSRSRSETSRYPRRERRRRSPGNAPPGGGGDAQSKIPSLCRHFLNGKKCVCVCVYVINSFRL